MQLHARRSSLEPRCEVRIKVSIVDCQMCTPNVDRASPVVLQRVCHRKCEGKCADNAFYACLRTSLRGPWNREENWTNRNRGSRVCVIVHRERTPLSHGEIFDSISNTGITKSVSTICGTVGRWMTAKWVSLSKRFCIHYCLFYHRRAKAFTYNHPSEDTAAC